MIAHLHDVNQGTNKDRKNTGKVPLSFREIKLRFSHLFPLKAGDPIDFDTNTPVENWFREKSHDTIAPDALILLIGRVCWLKNGTPVNRAHITQHLNELAKKPVQLRSLRKIVSRTVNSLIKKGSLEKQVRKLGYTPKGRMKPLHSDVSIFEAKPANEESRDRNSDLLSDNHPDKIMSMALKYTTQLKGTSPDTSKGTQEEICTRVQAALGFDFGDLDPKTLRDFANAAWDIFTTNGAGYEAGGGATSYMKGVRLRERQGGGGRRRG